MDQSPSVALRVPNTIEDLELVGAVLAGVADAVGLDALERSDMQTAALEACKNVVWHAYEGVRGPLEVEVRQAAGLLEVTVRDHGIGIRPHAGERTLPHTGMGMPIAHLLTRRITYTNIPDGGTEVRMEFSTPAVEAADAQLTPAALDLFARDDRGDSVLLALTGRPIVLALLPLVLMALASRAGMSPPGVAEVNRLALAMAQSEEGPAELRLWAQLRPGEVDVGFAHLSERLERMLRERARRGAEGRAPLLAEAPHGGGLTLRLRSAG